MESTVPSCSSVSCHRVAGSVSGVVKQEEQVKILVELIGATQLVVEDDDIDLDELFVYCEVHCGEERIHRCNVAGEGGANPIWTIEQQSLFVWSVDPSNLKHLAENGLTFRVYGKAKDSMPSLVKSSRIFLGQASIDMECLLANCQEERLELDIEDEGGDLSGQLGSIAVRFRPASPSDIRFVRTVGKQSIDWADRVALESFLRGEDDSHDHKQRKPVQVTTETDETEVAGASFLKTLSSAFDTTTRVLESRSSIKKVRVKPFPDPDRAEETTFMTSVDMKRETRRPSQNWVEAGSGKYGRLFLEILSCHDLPNVDVGEAVGNVTDSFICAVFEDAVVQTEVIDDELSPHWLPWTQRAFSFGMIHPASMLYLGVFDYDLGPLGHEPIGRVAVNVSSLQRDTLYTLKYNLYKSSNVTDRTSQGTLTIRLRVEMYDEKAALISALQPRPKIHVNVEKDKTFRVVRYTCFGEYDGEDQFDLAVVKSYINEIFEYKRLVSYSIGDSIRSLMFWRGQVDVFGILLPIHSVIFYIMGTTLVERPYLLPSFMILSIAWLMMATSWVRAQHPSPWHRPPSLWHYLSILKTGESAIGTERIVPRQGAKEAQEYEAAWKQRVEDDLKTASKRAEMQRELHDIGDETIGTEVKGGLSIGLVQRLGRYQGYIGVVCRFFRKIKLVVTWEESIMSFWITAVCLTVGLASLLLPWAFILTWTGRIVMWGLFGPHMKIVDLFLFQSKSSDKDVKKVLEVFKRKFRLARLKREEAVKLKAVKTLRFGKYITELPALNLSRHYDRPLPESSARVHRKPPAVDWTRVPRMPAQQLYGPMIPRPENAAMKNSLVTEMQQERLAVLEMELQAVIAAASRKNQGDDEPQFAGYELIESTPNLSSDHNDNDSSIATISTNNISNNMDRPVSIMAVDDHGQQVSLVPYESRDVAEFEEGKDGMRVPAVFVATRKTTEGVLQRQEESSVGGEEGVEVVNWNSTTNIAEDNDAITDIVGSSATTTMTTTTAGTGTSLPPTAKTNTKVNTDSLLENAKQMMMTKELNGGDNKAAMSVMYRQTETTYVAYYRPDGKGVSSGGNGTMNGAPMDSATDTCIQTE